MQTAKVSGNDVVKVGQYVCFKSDYEQTGKVAKIRTNMFGRTELVLTTDSDEGFGGDYLCGSNTTVELASDCWVE
jgi:hypothetical protein